MSMRLMWPTDASKSTGARITRHGGGGVRIDVITLFPEMVLQAARIGVTGRALDRGLWRLAVWNPRDYATDAHRTVDDRPYGGGPGMVMLPGPLLLAVGAAKDGRAREG